MTREVSAISPGAIADLKALGEQMKREEEDEFRLYGPRNVGEPPDDGAVPAEESEQRPTGKNLNKPAEPLAVEPVSQWANHPAPAPRDWIVENLIPACRVTSLLGNGGLGKTLIAGQIGVHVVMSRRLFGLEVNGGPVLGIFCEDEQEELERRIRTSARGEQIDLTQLDGLYALSRDGEDNVLCTFVNEHIVLSDFYRQLEATVAKIRPRLTILDTAADLFAGDFMNPVHVRQFLKVALGGLCVRYQTAILLLAHPSASAMSSGDGGGYSVAWHNSVRARLFLRRPKSDDQDAIKDRRVLEIKKSNYGPDGLTIPLLYHHGYFIPDPDPIQESGSAVVRPTKTDKKLSVAIVTYMEDANGAVVQFGAIFKHLQKSGDLPQGEYQAVRKPLQRALKALERTGRIHPTEVPKGYRMAPRA
jgi:hypothetical protein